METEFFYNEPKDDDNERISCRVGGDWDMQRGWDQRMIARKCAEDLWDNHDGWSESWPKTIALYESENGPELCRFEVDVEAVPEFLPRKKKAI
jgi:hypothetical protein